MFESSHAAAVRVVSLSCAALLLLALAPAGRRARAAKAAKVPRPPQVFDPTVDRLPPGFAGTDFTALFEAKSIAPKSEYETSDSYRTRVKAVSGDSYYALPLRPSTKYNADTEMFEVLIQAEELQPSTYLALYSYGDKAGGDRAIVLRESFPGKLKEYVGSNAFGATVTVTKMNKAQDAIVLRSSLGDSGGLHSMLLHMPLDQAHTIELAFLLVFTLEPAEGVGLTTTASGYSAPTIDTPIEVSTTTRYIFAGNAAVWAYNKKTGEVLRKFGLVTPSETPAQPEYGSHVPSEAEAWLVCQARVRIQVGHEISFPWYGKEYLVRHERNHFEFRSYFGDSQKPRRDWFCSIDYENGVAKEPRVTLGPEQ